MDQPSSHPNAPGFVQAMSRHTPLSLCYSSLSPNFLPNLAQRLVHTIQTTDWQAPQSTALLDEGQQAMAQLVRYRLTKFNDTLEPLPTWFIEATAETQTPRWIVLIDQEERAHPTERDLQQAAFGKMLDYVSQHHAFDQVVIKTPPLSEYPGVLLKMLQGSDNYHWLTDDCSLWDVLDHAAKVYTVDSHVGFEALMSVRPISVHTFGQPWYAGWGLTSDHGGPLHDLRTRPATVAQLFTTAYLLASCYHNPHTQEPTTLPDVLDVLWHQVRANRRNAGKVFCIKTGHFRGRRIEPFLQSTENHLHFVKTVQEAKALGLNAQSKVYVWGFIQVEGLQAAQQAIGFRLGRIEDAFIRSVGLGSDLIRPDSLAVDEQGIYYDPQQPSDLETLLNTTDFDARILQRSRQLQAQILAHDLSKYNIEYRKPLSMALPTDGRPIVLIASQVEDDASIIRGCPGIRDNLTLLKTVRQRNPDAFIIYKIHPDVVAGNREGHLPTRLLLQWADALSYQDNIAQLISQSDEVHTLTSLAGFEALMRGKKVFTYGLPFYAGWGLTIDELPREIYLPRRTRRLTLDELVAGTLIVYPTYIDPATGMVDTPENVVTRQIRALNTSAPWPVAVLSLALGRVLFQASRIGRRMYRRLRPLWRRQR
jgi:capsular polysaccharide export protein